LHGQLFRVCIEMVVSERERMREREREKKKYRETEREREREEVTLRRAALMTTAKEENQTNL
jgi:hypothetical protein